MPSKSLRDEPIVDEGATLRKDFAEQSQRRVTRKNGLGYGSTLVDDTSRSGGQVHEQALVGPLGRWQARRAVQA